MDTKQSKKSMTSSPSQASDKCTREGGCSGSSADEKRQEENINVKKSEKTIDAPEKSEKSLGGNSTKK